jgi:hypothetical protein
MFAGACPGFQGAPVTKGLVMVVTAASLLAAAASNGGSAHAGPPRALAALALGGPTQLLFGLGALYHARTIERLLGPAKYGAQVALAAGISACLRLVVGGLASLVWRAKGGGGGHSGSSSGGVLAQGILFAALVALVADVPPTAHFTLLGVPLTDRAFTYAAAAQLVWAGGQGAAWAAAAGVVAGLTLRGEALAALETPPVVQAALGRLFGAALGSKHRSRVVVPAAAAGAGFGAAAPQRRAGGPGGGGGARAPAEPSPAAVQQLVAMGFPADRARAALRDSGNDMQAALAILFGD